MFGALSKQLNLPVGGSSQPSGERCSRRDPLRASQSPLSTARSQSVNTIQRRAANGTHTLTRMRSGWEHATA